MTVSFASCCFAMAGVPSLYLPVSLVTANWLFSPPKTHSISPVVLLISMIASRDRDENTMLPLVGLMSIELMWTGS